jgi:hypothetical protein
MKQGEQGKGEEGGDGDEVVGTINNFNWNSSLMRCICYRSRQKEKKKEEEDCRYFHSAFQ